MSRSGLATRLYQGEAGLNIIGRRKLWFTIAGVMVLLAVLSFVVRGFTLGIEFEGGNSLQVPASVGTLAQAEEKVKDAVGSQGGKVGSAQKVGGAGGSSYEFRTSELNAEQSNAVKTALAADLGIDAKQISASQVSAAWGAQVTQRAILGLVLFVALVMVYLILRFEWRMAVGAVSSLLLNLVLTAGVYSLVGFEVTPSTIIGFLTILGFALYDVVVVFDKVQENTRGITASNVRTYSEAANLAINQTLMRSINTGLVALLPVGGLLFIGAGLLGAGTLKDLGLVLFVGMAIAVYSSIFFATPVLTTLKDFEPKIQTHTRRVLARRTALGRNEAVVKTAGVRTAGDAADEVEPNAELAGSAPKVGSRPAGRRPNRPGSGKRR